MGSSSPLQNPLQLGETLYEVSDFTVVGTPKADFGTPEAKKIAYCSRNVLDSDGFRPAESLPLMPQDRILDAKAVTIPKTARQSVFVLTADELHIIEPPGNDGQEIVRWPVCDLSVIVGIDPQVSADVCLLVMGKDARGIFLRSVGCHSGSVLSTTYLPKTVDGTVLGALLVRRQLEAHIVICTVRDSLIEIHDLGARAVGARPVIDSVTTVPIGRAISPDIGLTTAALKPGTPDQQVVVTHSIDTDSNEIKKGSLCVSVLSWAESGKGPELRKEVAMTHETSVNMAPQDTPKYRVAAGRLLGNGADQLVVGYRAAYRSTSGCVGLLLFELQPQPDGSNRLVFLSDYAAGNKGAQPLASIDFRIAVGLFGDPLPEDQPTSARGKACGDLGVLVAGAGASFRQLLDGQASITAGLVTVDPARKTFPPQEEQPGEPRYLSELMIVDYRSKQGFYAFPSDVKGKSVILGPPTYSRTSGSGQLLAVIQAPPYQDDPTVTVEKPSLTFSEGQSGTKGVSVVSSNMWMFSKEFGESIGIRGQTLSHSISESYGNGFDNTADNSTTFSVQTIRPIAEADYLLTCTIVYDVWTYPVYRKSVQEKPDGSMAVIFPTDVERQQYLVPAYDPSLGYKPRSQIGSLLSYVDQELDGYVGSNRIFDLMGLTVSSDFPASLIFDENHMASKNIGKSFTVHNSATDSAHFTYSDSLLDYIPVSFGLNLSEGESYSQSDVETTMLSHSATMSISISGGRAADPQYLYGFTPYIYQHKTMGCLMVGYKVDLRGSAWNRYYATPRVALQALCPGTSNKVLAGFSRSISFRESSGRKGESSDRKVQVSAEVFNNSTQSTNACVEFYKGCPVENTEGSLDPTGDCLGKECLQLQPTGRGTASMEIELAQADQVVVVVYPSTKSNSRTAYWAIYPPSKFQDYFDALRAEPEGTEK
ncbi:hypothetical protein ACL02U_27235 [Streptomyces sp. MS06]|uniref:hypothetical protein n=1 Tax=Streptomyces sp. MS06 TaxID=3385974 RepID=UPI0039A0A9E1